MHETFSAYEDLQEAELRVEKAYRGLVGLTVASIITASESFDSYRVVSV